MFVIILTIVLAIDYLLSLGIKQSVGNDNILVILLLYIAFLNYKVTKVIDETNKWLYQLDMKTDKNLKILSRMSQNISGKKPLDDDDLY